MLSVERHDELVALFYASAAGEVPWRRTLETIAADFKSSATLFGIHASFSEVLAMESHNYSQEFVEEFFKGEIYANDPRIGYLERVPDGGIYYDEMLYDVREIELNRWVRASIDALGVFDQIGAKLRLDNERFVSLGLLRTRREGRVTEAGILAFTRLVPAIEQACAFGYTVGRVAETQDILLEVIAGKADAIFLLDRRGNPAFINDAGRNLLRSADGLTVCDGIFRAHRPHETRTLTRLIANTLSGVPGSGQTSGGQMLVSRPSRNHPFVVRVLPAPRRESFLSGCNIACIVYVQDLAIPEVPARQSLEELFGLTRRETDLAVELARTSRLGEAARRCGMAYNTARNHLRNIFLKAKVGNQAEAVQLFSRITE